MNRKQALSAGAVTITLCFIWGNSLLSGEQSGSISGGLLAWLLEVLPMLSWLPEWALRKMGHVSEFAALGFFLSSLFVAARQRGIHRITMPLLAGHFAAHIDETIQFFRPGRGPSVIDIWIDTLGLCIGMGGFWLIHWFFTRKGTNT